MTDLFDADVCARAARVLRERAEATASKGPWRDRLYDGRWQVVDEDGDVVADCPEFDMDNVFIATMHPGLAVALADWLDMHAELLAEHQDCVTDCAAFDRETDHGLAVARAVLGEDR